MDPSHPPPQQQRERVHNPNYPPNPSPRPTLPSFQPPIQQPPPQQPPYDPFNRSGPQRDPFLPSFSSKQRDQQSSLNGRHTDPHANDSFHHAPPPPSPFRIGPHPPPQYPEGRRSSLPGGHGHGHLEPPPSHGPGQHASSIFSRQMPPPASSPKYEASHSHSLSRSSTKGYPFDNVGSTRPPDAGPSGRGRSNGSMSINSLVESSPGPRRHMSAWSPTLKNSGRNEPPHITRTQPNSPPEFDYRTENGSASFMPRSRLDDRESDFGGREAMRSPLGPQARAGEVVENGVHGFSRLLQPFHHSPAVQLNKQPPRPYSQPAVYEQGHLRDPLPPGPHEMEAQTAVRYGADAQERAPFDRFPRDRAVSDIPARTVNSFAQVNARPSGQPMFGRLGETFPSEGNNHPRPAFEDRELFPGQAGRSHEPSHVQITGPPLSDVSAVSARNEPYTRRLPAQHRDPSRISLEHSSAVRPRDAFAVANTAPQNSPPVIDSNLRQSIEDNRSHHRSFLGLRPDLHESMRRNERSSPLPQAVQGAQSQPAGSGRDPSIKSEFGRMFSGLGSGVSSTPQPMQTPYSAPTSRYRSPLDIDREDDTRGRREVIANAPSRGFGPGSRGGRKGKRVIDEAPIDAESADGRFTPTGHTRAAKRNKYTQPPVPHHHHHHHHPVVPHHHHHHHHKNDEEHLPAVTTQPGIARHDSLRFPTPTQAATPVAPVPHHHHHVNPHHHHHLTKPKLPPPPMLKVMTTPLLRSVANLPRKHLGSQLYKPSFSTPPSATTTIESTHMVDTSPNPLPYFERNKANNTFTIRISRYFLTDAQREQLCASRRVWGTDVYTDDSDPLCAAIHSGWIRGAWAVGVDANLILGLEQKDQVQRQTTQEKEKDAEEEPKLKGSLTSPPTSSEGGPAIPPPDLDLHLTLLILPPLEKYESAVWHGVKSHSWGDNHDGMSFKILQVRWVDDNGCVEERGPSAVKERLENVTREMKRVLVNPIKRPPRLGRLLEVAVAA